MRTHAFFFLVAAAALAACGDDEAMTTATGAGGESSSASSTGDPCAATPETCDGKDQDCDGVADDGDCSAKSASQAWFLEGSGTDHVRGVAFDENGNIYVTGGVSAPADLGMPVVGAQGYVASLDPQGAVRWSVLWGSTNAGYDYGQDVSVANGMVCAGGSFAGPFDFGGGVRTTVGFNDAVVLCLDAADGTYRWDRSFGGALSDVVEGVRVSSTGDVVATGSVESGTADFGAGSIAAPGYFVARYGPDGAYRWAHTYPQSGADFGASPGVDAAGNVYAVGHFYGTVDFGGGPRTIDPSAAVLLALDPDGGYRWDVVGTTAVFYGAMTTSNGGVVIGGEFFGSLALGGPPLTPHSDMSPDAFAASFHGDGSFAWQFAAGPMRGFGIAVGASDEVVLAAEFGETIQPGDAERTIVGSTDMIAIGLTPDGKYLWDFTLGGPDQDTVNAVAIDATGRIALGGETWGALEVGAQSHVNAGGDDGALIIIE